MEGLKRSVDRRVKGYERVELDPAQLRVLDGAAAASAALAAPAPAAQPANMLEVTFATTGPLGMTWVPDQVHHPDGSGRLTEVCVLKEMKGGSPAVRRPLRFDPPQCPSDQLLHMIPSWDRKEISRNTRSR